MKLDDEGRSGAERYELRVPTPPPSERERAVQALLRTVLVELCGCADDLACTGLTQKDIDTLSLRLGRAYEQLRAVPERLRGRDQARALADALFTCLTAVRNNMPDRDLRAYVRLQLGAARALLTARGL